MARIWNKHKQIHPVRNGTFSNGADTPLKPHTSSLRGRRRVFVGLSGGVDSSVSAALLKKAGYDVTGVFIKVWNPVSERLNLSGDPRFNFFDSCQSADDRLDAMRVCASLGIPFKELNLEKGYKRDVVDYMISEYKVGRTPNPDVMCNRFIKFGAFYNWAMANGAQYVATGHYARIRTVKDKACPPIGRRGLRIKDFGLLAGSDLQKDQSYFLWQLRQEQLPHILFPVGELKKLEVRRLARKFGLMTADKKDSQGLCFVGKVEMKDFLSQYLPACRGAVLNERGDVIGEHEGAWFYTIGERFKAANTYGRKYLPHLGKAQYVIAKDMKRNTLTVLQKNPAGDLPRAKKIIIIGNANWVSGRPVRGEGYSARIRYRQPLQECRVEDRAAKTISFVVPQTVAPGQSLVLYDGEVCLGGGIVV